MIPSRNWWIVKPTTVKKSSINTSSPLSKRKRESRMRSGTLKSQKSTFCRDWSNRLKRKSSTTKWSSIMWPNAISRLRGDSILRRNGFRRDAKQLRINIKFRILKLSLLKIVASLKSNSSLKNESFLKIWTTILINEARWGSLIRTLSKYTNMSSKSNREKTLWAKL